jgi:simple sugar transport system substrate-binding protein
MSEHDVVGDAIERLEWKDSKQESTPQSRAHAFSRRAALTGGAAGLAAMALNASSAGAAGSGPFGSHKKYHFVFVNHVTTNVFFVPTQYGIADACSLLGATYSWTGSSSSNVTDMVNAVNSAVTAKADGIAVALIDPTAFNSPVAKALAAKIPVVAYNADATGNPRLAYIGQDLMASGVQMGEHIKALVPSGDVALFIATPGSLNIQPRINGAIQSLKGSKLKYHVVATGAAVPQELTTIDSYWVGHKSTKGLFAVDAGSTQSVAQVIQKYKLKGTVKGGGYDLTAITEKLLAAGDIQFTIDQQPYLQGFLPTLELFMYQVSKGLSGIADIDTGLKFLTNETVVPYSSTKSRYEGTSSAPGVS